MGEVIVTGTLICRDARERAIVRQYLPVHIELTLAEPGCLAFEVTQSENDNEWIVCERFSDAEAFDYHQRRVAQSEWGQVTSGIERDYTIGTTR